MKICAEPFNWNYGQKGGKPLQKNDNYNFDRFQNSKHLKAEGKKGGYFLDVRRLKQHTPKR